jgi:hypothetical protein
MVPPTGETESSESSTVGSSEATPVTGSEPPTDAIDGDSRNRRRAALYALPFLALGVGNAVLILNFGLEPLWAFAQLPPILFTTALTYIVFSTDFLDDR